MSNSFFRLLIQKCLFFFIINFLKIIPKISVKLSNFIFILRTILSNLSKTFLLLEPNIININSHSINNNLDSESCKNDKRHRKQFATPSNYVKSVFRGRHLISHSWKLAVRNAKLIPNVKTTGMLSIIH